MAKFSHLISIFNLDMVMCQMSACSKCVNCGAGMQQSLVWGVLPDTSGEVCEKLLGMSGVWAGADPILCSGPLGPKLINPCMCLPLCICWSFFCWRVYTHQLCHSVDIDLPLLQASTEEHGCCHQKVVSYTISIDIHRSNLTAVVGANLKETYMHVILKS